VLIYEVFNGDYNGRDNAGQTRGVPPTMHSSYKRLCNANPKARISVSAFLDQGSRRDAFFDTPLIKLTEGIDNLGIKSEEEREQFLEYVPAVFAHFRITNNGKATWSKYQMTFPRIFSS
jgi:SCY1-like protein 1